VTIVTIADDCRRLRTFFTVCQEYQFGQCQFLGPLHYA
jgi:hypothetical protein